MESTQNERDFVARDRMQWHERNCPDQWERYRFAARWLRPGDRVLDIACGSGYGTFVLSEATGRRALGLDLAPAPIQWAQQHYGDRADFELSTPAKLQEVQGRFDAVVSLETLEHMPEAAGRTFLLQLAHALRPGGRLVLSTPLHEGPGRFSPGNPFHLREYSWSELGLIVAKCFTIEHRFTQMSRLAQLRGLLDGATAANADAPAGVRAEPTNKGNTLRSRLAGWMRTRPFWQRGKFVERPARFGGVQIVVARRDV